MGYDEQYAETGAFFGAEAEPVLARLADRLATGATVLDIGAGQGRNARFLAERDVTVHALEPSRVAASTLEDLAAQRRLPIQVHRSTFEEFDPPVTAYDGITVFGLIPDLEWTAIHRLVQRIDDWGAPGTVVWVTGFTTEDPAYARHLATWEQPETNSFRGPDGQVRTYLEPGRILELFDRYSVLHHREGLGPEHRHGHGPVHRHGMFEAVLSRASD
jgi:cyclopropane fatty-acyl-phospholipid synthase-like methyltransferase